MVNKKHARWVGRASLALACAAPLCAQSATHPASYFPSFAPDVVRITQAVDYSKLVAVKQSGPSNAISKADVGVLPPSQPIRNITLLLKRSARKQSQFQGYLAQLTNPGSPYFHHWLTAQQIGTMFGPAPADIAEVKQWLASQGLKVTSVSATGMMLHFSGSASAVGQAFHTALHSFKVNGHTHFANTSGQEIPAALASVVQGAASLDNFFPQPLHHDVGVVTKDRKTGAWKSVSKVSTQFTVPGGTIDPNVTYDVAPADFDTIYKVNPLWRRSTPIRGAGQSVAVLERTDVLPADVKTFRSAFLPANAQGVVSYVNPALYAGDTSCADPGRNGDEGEAALDAEWAGAAAPDATIVFASCDDANSPTFGAFTAANNLLEGDSALPQIMSLSYGECEPAGFVNGIANEAGDLWSQAAAEGVTVFVSTGDSGSAGCDQNQSDAYQGVTVNSMASTPYNVAVGGTDFDDLNNYARYWASTNLPLDESAIGYIPEQTWNNSCASSSLDAVLKEDNGVRACNDPANAQFLNTTAGSGGASTNWFQPVFQAGIYGSANYGARLMPDVSLFAANGLYGHALVFCMSDPDASGVPCDYSNPDNVLYSSAGGTSFAAPAMAGVQALINQNANQASGNILPAFYNIASKEYGTNGSPNTATMQACNSSNGASIGASCVFNDVTVGNIAVPCSAGGMDCYSGSGVEKYGVLSAGGSASLVPAWETHAGYSMATGLGSINAANLVDAVAKFDGQHRTGYSAPYDFVTTTQTNFGDGFSDIATVDPATGLFTAIGMKGSVILSSGAQTVTPGYSIGVAGDFFVSSFSQWNRYNASLAWTGPDNQLYVWLSDGTGSVGHYYPIPVSSPYPAGWQLVGAGNFDGTAAANPDQLFWWNSETGQIGWWTLNDHYFFILGKQHYFVNATISPLIDAATGYVPRVADVNGDGFADIVWTSTSDNSVYVWINDHNGNFVRHRIADHPAGFTLFGAGDVNGDGNTDLIWTNPSAHQMAWWDMSGFNVINQQVRDVAAGYTMASIADYDGDGLADILWQGAAGDAYEWQSTGDGFESFRVADAAGNPLVIPAGSIVQPNRIQGTVTGGIDTGIGTSH